MPKLVQLKLRITPVKRKEKKYILSLCCVIRFLLLGLFFWKRNLGIYLHSFLSLNFKLSSTSSKFNQPPVPCEASLKGQFSQEYNFFLKASLQKHPFVQMAKKSVKVFFNSFFELHSVSRIWKSLSWLC